MRSNPENPTGILVPVKDLSRAKSRLDPCLSPSQRKHLSLSLLTDMLRTLRRVKGQAVPAVVTSDSEVAAQAHRQGVRVLEEPSGATLGTVVDSAARSTTWFEPDHGLLVLPVDLPWVNASAIRSLLDRVREHTAALVPDEDRAGTNVIWRRPATAFDCQYEGTESFDAHLQAAHSNGLNPWILEPPEFVFDLDTPADWNRLLEHPDRLSRSLRSFLSRCKRDRQVLSRARDS